MNRPRDLNLIRTLLFQFEKSDRYSPVEGFTDADIVYHCQLLADEGYIDGRFVFTSLLGDKFAAGMRQARLLAHGHDFLVAARDEGRWKKVTSSLAQQAGTVTLTVLKTALLIELKRHLGQ